MPRKTTSPLQETNRPALEKALQNANTAWQITTIRRALRPQATKREWLQGLRAANLL